MKKIRYTSGKWASDIHLNWDDVRSIISDVKAVDKISTEASTTALDTKALSINTKTQKEEKPVPIEKIRTNWETPSRRESVYSSNEQDAVSPQEGDKENLLNIVEDLKSCDDAIKGTGLSPIARIRCNNNGKEETFWFIKQLVNMYDFKELQKFGRFVPQYSDLAIKMQKYDIGKTLEYNELDNHKQAHTRKLSLENRSDLQNQTIVIAGDSLTYQYRNLQDFLYALHQNQEDIKDVENKVYELRKLVEDLKNDKNTAHQRTQITKTINELQKEYRILTQQQEDLKNISIYIRKQGEMRYSHNVDPIQTRIMSENRFDGKTVVIKGGPGTGKTTTMIHRLAFLTNIFAIDEDERKKLGQYKLNSHQRRQLRERIKKQRDWMFFSPSRLLRDYLADAMKKEGLKNTSDKVWNWKDYCRLVLQENYHLLEMNGSTAPFKACNTKGTLFYQNSNIVNVFTDFYLEELRSIKTQLPVLNAEGKVYAWTSIALNIQKKFAETDTFDLARFVSLFNSLESVYGKDCQAILQNRKKELNELANDIYILLDKHEETKRDLEDIFDLTYDDLDEITEEENNGEAEDENTDNLLSKIKNWVKPIANNKKENNKVAAEIQKWLKAFCYSKVDEEKKLSGEQTLIAEILLPVLGDNFDDRIKKIGELMIFEQFAQYTRGVRAIMLNGIPAKYKKWFIRHFE